MAFFIFLFSVGFGVTMSIFFLPNIVIGMFGNQENNKDGATKYWISIILYLLLAIFVFSIIDASEDILSFIGVILGNLLSLSYGIYYLLKYHSPEYLIKNKFEKKQFYDLEKQIEELEKKLEMEQNKIKRLNAVEKDMDFLHRTDALKNGVYEEFIEHLEDLNHKAKCISDSIDALKKQKAEIVDKYRFK